MMRFALRDLENRTTAAADYFYMHVQRVCWCPCAMYNVIPHAWTCHRLSVQKAGQEKGAVQEEEKEAFATGYQVVAEAVT
jgi:hypothetical protein